MGMMRMVLEMARGEDMTLVTYGKYTLALYIWNHHSSSEVYEVLPYEYWKNGDEGKHQGVRESKRRSR